MGSFPMVIHNSIRFNEICLQIFHVSLITNKQTENITFSARQTGKVLSLAGFRFGLSAKTSSLSLIPGMRNTHFAALQLLTPAQCLDSQLHHTPVLGRGINSTEITNMELHLQNCLPCFYIWNLSGTQAC